MADCHSCYWADRNAETHMQSKNYEPDYLAQNLKAGGKIPDIRVIKSCGAGAKYYKNYAGQKHNCNLYEDEAEAQAEEAEDIERKREEWEHPTSRLQLTDTRNLLIAIDRMSIKNNEAMDILLTLMGRHFDEFPQTITHLDDMNMRGGQIVLALKYCHNKYDRLVTAARERDKYMVEYVNKHYHNAHKEQAVTRGAHLYGHRPATTRKLSAPANSA